MIIDLEKYFVEHILVAASFWLLKKTNLLSKQNISFASKSRL